jgi:hypothetical protein
LEEFPNINAMQLFEELCVQFPGSFTRKQYKTLALLQGVKLSQAVSPWITGLELNEEFKRSLIRMFFKAPRHLLPMVPKDIRTSTLRFVAEPTIRFWPDDNAACASRLACNGLSLKSANELPNVGEALVQ